MCVCVAGGTWCIPTLRMYRSFAGWSVENKKRGRLVHQRRNNLHIFQSGFHQIPAQHRQHEQPQAKKVRTQRRRAWAYTFFRRRAGSRAFSSRDDDCLLPLSNIVIVIYTLPIYGGEAMRHASISKQDLSKTALERSGGKEQEQNSGSVHD